MPAKNEPAPVHDSTIREQEFSRDQYLDLWKYFDGVGGADKDRMVGTVTWLLALAVGILAYIGVEDIDLDKLCVTRPREAVLFGLLGVFLCLLSGFLVFAFGARANIFWERADKCEDRIAGLPELLAGEPSPQKRKLARLYQKVIEVVSRPHDPKLGRLAVAFNVFLVFTSALLIALIVLVGWALAVILK